jgi:hypothetical protein
MESAMHYCGVWAAIVFFVFLGTHNAHGQSQLVVTQPSALKSKMARQALQEREAALAKIAPSARRVIPAMGALDKLRHTALTIEERTSSKKIEPRSAQETLITKLARVANQQRTLLLAQSKNPAPAGKVTAIQQTGVDEDLLGPLTIAYGDTATGVISAGDTSDVYLFTGEVGQLVTLDLTSADGDPFLELEFAGEIIAVDDDSGEGLNALIENLTLPASGQYTVRVSMFEGAEGTYSLALSQGEPPIVLAGVLEAGSALAGTLTSGQLDVYTLGLTTLSQVQINLISEAFDTYMVLFSGSALEDLLDENILHADDDGGVNTNSQLAVELAAGTYLVAVRSFSGDAQGAYSLSLATDAIGSDEDAAGALTISASTPAVGGLFPEGDEDLYTFVGEAGQVVNIALSSADFDAYLQLEFNGEIITADDDGGDGSNALLESFVLPVSGNYNVRVRSFSGVESGFYELAFAQSESPFTLVGQASTGTSAGAVVAGAINFYTFELASFSQVQIDLVSEEFDAFLVLYEGATLSDRRADNRLLSDDDSGGQLNSQIAAELPAGTYLVEVRSVLPGEAGAYELSLNINEFGDDEDAAGALALEFGVTVEAGIFPAGDSDRYVFTGQAGQVVNISLQSTSFDAFLELELDGELIAIDDDSGGERNALLAGFVLPANGEYTVLTSALSQVRTGVYQLLLQDLTPPLVFRETIAADSTNGALLEGGQIHLYPWVLDHLSQVQIDLVSSDFDAYLVVYEGSTAANRSSAYELGADDDGGGGLNSRLGGILEAGSYLIEVRSVSSSATGSYTLVTTATAIEGGEDEDDPLPIPLAYGATAAGHFFPVADVDRYTFSGLAGDVIDIALDSEDFDAYVKLLFDNKIIAEDDDGGPDLNSLIKNHVLPVSGQYIVHVSALAEGIGAYELVLSDNSATLALGDTLTAGNISGEIERTGQVRLYPFVLAERSQVQLRLVASQLAGELSLFGGSGSGDRQANNRIAMATTGEVGSALIDRPLAAGTYLVEVRGATSQVGPFGLELKIESLSGQARDRITFIAGEVNGAALNSFSPQVTVKPGEKISGTLSLRVLNSHATSDVFPVGATPTWGTNRSSYWLVEDWASPGESTLALNLELDAPQEPGTYYILVVAAAEPSVESILSGTHSRATPIWGDSDDVAAWSQAQIDHAQTNGWTSVEWFSNYQTDVGAFALEVTVSQEADIPRGPVSLDLNNSAGNQRQRQRQINAIGDTVEVELYIKDAPEINGWSARIEYDPTQLNYSSDSFGASDFIPGLVALVDEKSNYIEIGGTVLGSTESNSGDGLLGALSFVVQEDFSQSTSLVITQVALRTPNEGRTKEQVRSLATLSRAVEIDSGPISLDFDLAVGDQEKSLLQGVAAGQQVEVQLNVSTAPEINGWSARIEYDPAQLGYVSGSFSPSAFISGIVPLVSEKEGRLDLGGSVLGGGATNAGDGVLGTATFVALPGFAESSDLVVTRISFNTLASGETIQSAHAVATLSAEPLAPELAGDFSGDAQVDFSDFFLFADHFGSSEVDTDWDPLYDLNDDGEVDFSDFFVFADSFNGVARAKLMELAHEHIGLPATAVLEQNFPNPFNASTLVRYVVAAAGPVRLHIYNINGQRIISLVEGLRTAGVHEASWNGLDEQGRSAASGVYFYMLRASGTTQVRKMLYLR